MSRSRSSARQRVHELARRLWRAVNSANLPGLLPAAQAIRALGQSNFERALLAPLEQQAPAALGRLAPAERSVAEYVRKLLLLDRFDVYDEAFLQLQRYQSVVSTNVGLPRGIRERLGRLVIKTCLRSEAVALAESLLPRLADGDADWLARKRCDLQNSQSGLSNETWLALAAQDGSDEARLVIERRAAHQSVTGQHAAASALLAAVGGQPSPERQLTLLNLGDATEPARLRQWLHRYGLGGAEFQVDEAGERSVNTLVFDSVAAAESHGRVTVIFPVRNCADTIQAALSSIINQSYQDLELIVIDDASDDATPTLIAGVLESHPGTRAQFIRNPLSVGPYVSRNIGIRRASGDFITINDGDDVSHPERIARHVARLTRSRRFQYETSLAVRLTRSGQFLPQPWFPSVYSHLAGATLFARRAVFEQAGVFDSVRFDGDFEYLRRLETLVGPAGRCQLPLYFADAGGGSLTTSGSGGLDALRRSELRLDYHRRLLDMYANRPAAAALRLDGTNVRNHPGFSDLPICVSDTDVAAAVAAGVAKLPND